VQPDYHGQMTRKPSTNTAVQPILHWLTDWWRLIHFGAVILVLALSPSSYRRDNRPQLVWHIYRNTAPILLGFSVLCALVTVVLTRIVLTTALSYGLTQYALQVLIRVLVLELIPLTAALFVALRCTIPDGAEIAALHTNGQWDMIRASRHDPVRREVLPRVVAGLLAGMTLAALSSIVALVVAYGVGYGFTLTGLPAYTRMFGQVFSPAVSLILLLKTVLFSLAVSLIPMASALYGLRGLYGASVRTSTDMHALVRMFSVLLLIEVASLVGNYY
jgi:phospholipid/cholesterol/gamma-HCH transport system permease protein